MSKFRFLVPSKRLWNATLNTTTLEKLDQAYQAMGYIPEKNLVIQIIFYTGIETTKKSDKYVQFLSQNTQR